MSWLDNIETPLRIRTGDGKEFTPEWVNAQKVTSYNLAQFEFPNVEGTLVKRNQPKGNKYNLEIFFQGDDHLVTARDFEVAARDPRFWTIVHPYYGEIKVHPVELVFDNSGHNVTKITGQVLETIVDVFPQGSVSQEDQITQEKAEIDEQGSQNYANDNPSPDSKDVGLMSETVDDQDKRTSRTITDSVQAADFRNNVNQANRAINNATNDPLTAIRAIDAVLNYPAQVQGNLTTRITNLTDALAGLIGKIGNSPQTLPASQKRFHEKAISSNVTSLAQATANTGEGGGVTSRSQGLGITQQIIENYNALVVALDSMQTTQGGKVDSYIPNQNNLLRTQDLVNFVVAQFFNITLTAKQEHRFIVEAETTPLILAHQFYGLDEADENLDFFIETNNIGLNEMLLIKKGRVVSYFI